jgi:hypothetical protein
MELTPRIGLAVAAAVTMFAGGWATHSGFGLAAAMLVGAWAMILGVLAALRE